MPPEHRDSAVKYSIPDTPIALPSFSSDELPTSIKQELDRDLSILLANTDDMAINSLLDFTNIPNEQTNLALNLDLDFGYDFDNGGNGHVASPISENKFYQHTNSHIGATSLVRSPVTEVRIDGESTLIDTQLLEEIDSVLRENKPASIKSPHKVAKKPSLKRLQQTKPRHISKSETPHLLQQHTKPQHLLKEQAMAQTAAVFATNSMSPSKQNSVERHESARAAARAVGSGGSLPRPKIATSPTMNLSLHFKKATKFQLPSRPNNTPISTGSLHTANTDLQTSLLQSPDFSNQQSKGLNVINTKPSSTSIFSETTGFSNHSKFSHASKDSSMFEIIPHKYASTETLETIASQEPRSQRIPPLQPLTNYKLRKENKIDTQVIRLIERTNSIESSVSTSSMNSMSEYLNLSTPSPHCGNLPNASSTFTPPNNVGGRTMSFDAIPVTPVSKTAAKFEQLSTNSPVFERNINTVIQNGPKMSIWKTSNSNSKQPISKTTTVRHKSLDIDNMKGFSILELSVDKSRLKAKPIDTHNKMLGATHHYISQDRIESKIYSKNNNSNSKNNDNNNINNTSNFNNNNTNSHNNYTHTTSDLWKANLHHSSSLSTSSCKSVTSTVSTVSNHSMHSTKGNDPMNIIKEVPLSSKPSRAISKPIMSNTIIQTPKRKLSSASSSDVPFQSLITTFSKEEHEEVKPQVYSNMMQGMVEFQVKLGHKRGVSR